MILYNFILPLDGFINSVVCIEKKSYQHVLAKLILSVHGNAIDFSKRRIKNVSCDEKSLDADVNIKYFTRIYVE